MIMSYGKVYDTKEQPFVLNNLEEKINETLSKRLLTPYTVVAALDKLSQEIESGKFDRLIKSLTSGHAEKNVMDVVKGLKKERVEYKLHTELGYIFTKEHMENLSTDFGGICRKVLPLGVLFHIAAGNIDTLPVFSVLEGLLTGNINILKLPQADSGLSIEILLTLIRIEPKLEEFIHVFDTPSTDIASIKQMASFADGIVVWGGEEAISAVRQFAPIGCKLIEWGPKLGFAYISGYEEKQKELEDLAEHIATTRQLLCSSCQVIYIDTDDMNKLEDFSKEFLPILEAAYIKYKEKSIGAMAEHTIRCYNAKIESIVAKKKEDLLIGGFCSLKACEDKSLELSEMFGNCLVKRLPRSEILSVLRHSKWQLQTAGLICKPERRKELSDILFRSGIVRVMHAGDMSQTYTGESHDGSYALNRYVRIVNFS